MSRKVGAIVLIVVAAAILIVMAWNGRSRNSGGAGAGGDDEHQLQDLTRQWDEAYARRDGPALAKLMADDFVFTTANGVVMTRPQYLSQNLKSPDIAVETPVASEDIKVRLYGNTAVVASRAAQRGQRFDRDPNVRYQYTDVWVKGRGGWHVVASQSTRIMPRPGPFGPANGT